MKELTLQLRCVNEFKDKGRFTANEVYKWYCLNKRNPETLPSRASIYSLIIYPLIHKEIMTKLSSGFYVIDTDRLDQLVSTQMSNETPEDREWNEYIQKKIKEADEKEKKL